MSTKTAIADRYVRCDDFSKRVEGVEFAPEVWAVFARLEEPRNAPELAAALSLEPETVQAAIRRLLRRKLIRKHVLGWRDFATSTASTAPNTPTASAAPTAPSATPPPPAPEPSPLIPIPFPPPPLRAPNPVISVTVKEAVPAPRPAPAPDADTPLVSLCVGPARPPAPPEKALVVLRFGSSAVPAAPLASPATPAAGGWRLRPVIDAIGARAGGGLAGQLLVYRVFLQVPTDLLQTAGLHSLSLVDEHFTVNHAPLREAIVEAARHHADVDLGELLAA